MPMGVLLQVHVVAESAAGVSAEVQAGPTFTYYSATPGAPTGLAVTATGLVTFSAPTSDGASSIKGYRVLAVPASGSANITVSGRASPLQLGELVNGQNYTVRKPRDCTGLVTAWLRACFPAFVATHSQHRWGAAGQSVAFVDKAL